MNPWLSLALPFQWPGLVLVAISATGLTLILGGANGAMALMMLLPAYLLITWVNKYAFALLDAAANGEKDAPVPSTEMLGPFGDPRSWVLPLFAALVALATWRLPGALRWPMLALALLLAPLALAATAVTDRFLEAFNPLRWWRCLRGLGAASMLLFGGVAALGTVMVLVWRADVRPLFEIAVFEMGWLCMHALTGGFVHARRNELDFTPRRSPERLQEQRDAERARQRQRVFDEVFIAVRARRDAQAIATMKQWLAASEPHQAEADIAQLVAAGSTWNEPRGYVTLLRNLLGELCQQRRAGAALGVLEGALAQSPGFKPGSVDQAVMLARFAAQTGRRTLARRVLANALEGADAETRGVLEALQRELPS